ncbi:hypothetical protein V2J09_020299, partial [Rumex salicifolius]
TGPIPIYTDPVSIRFDCGPPGHLYFRLKKVGALRNLRGALIIPGEGGENRRDKISVLSAAEALSHPLLYCFTCAIISPPENFDGSRFS